MKQISKIPNSMLSGITEGRTSDVLGDLLKVGDYGLGYMDVTYNGNLNDAPFGFLVVSADAPNNFFVQNCFLVTITGSPLSTRKKQILYTFGDNRTAERLYTGTNWTGWSVVFNQANILGTVSQSGGIPTGAIIQRGANANGEFTRFADGTQECRISQMVISDLGTDWLFPMSFSSVPNISGVANTALQSNGEVSPRVLGKNIGNGGYVKLYLLKAVNDNEIIIPRVAGIADVQASGRWYQ
jgi:hypothetical protein